MTTAQQGAVVNRVARGIEYLEEEIGEGWWKKIKVRKLDMSGGMTCIAGQLFGGYFSAPFFKSNRLHNSGDRKGVALGMQTPSWMFRSGAGVSRNAYFDALEVEWKKQIAALRKA